MPSNSRSEIVVRRAQPSDGPACGRICYQAFSTINAVHNFPCDFPNAEVPIGLLTKMFSFPGFHCVVAECVGRIVGSNAVDERSVIAGVGPITVDPALQNGGVGRLLMEAVMDHALGNGAVGIRLVQAAFHNRSYALYTSLGFRVREPLCCLQGKTREREIAGCTVRAATSGDLDACNVLSREVHGFDRGADLAYSIEEKTARVVERSGRITGFASALAFFGHATAETDLDLEALIASAESFGGPGILLPAGNAAVLRWCLANGLRIVQPMTLMSTGLYNEPAGAWLSSIEF